LRDLAPIVRHLQTSRAKLLSDAEEVSDLRWRESPAPDCWSAAEVFAHVAIIEERTIFGMKRLLQSAPKPVPLRKRFHLHTLEFMESTRGTDVSAYHYEHPFLGNLNMYEWFRSIGFHELRHAKQIRELVETFHH